ncbi:MAG TPA: discoidin domain-containing protein [Hanamia sp.]
MNFTSRSKQLIFSAEKIKKLSFFLSFILILIPGTNAQQYTRGVGKYPGDPAEDFSPSMKIDNTHYRNLALHRAAYQSSSYDYNLTAQLITDGIVDSKLPGWLVVITSNNDTLKRDGREHLLDHHASSQQRFDGSNAWVQIEMAGNYNIPLIDSLALSGSVIIDTLQQPKHWDITVRGSNDGITWEDISKASGDSLPGEDAMASMAKRFHIDLSKMPPAQLAFFKRFAPPNRRLINYPFKLNNPVHYKFYRLSLNNPTAQSWSVSDLEMFKQGRTAPVGGPYNFSSAWKSAGSGEEWVYVDLGAVCSFNDLKLDWIKAALTGSLQVSDDATNWKEIAALPSNGSNNEDIKLPKEIKGRYVRVLMTKPVSEQDGYILSEMEVMGKGDPVPVAHAEAKMGKDGKDNLDGGSWKLQRASLVQQDGNEISSPSFNDNNWLVGTVPATTLVSYLNDGAVPDPNFGKNQFAVSDSYFYADFWYRDEFATPPSYKGRRMYLNFDGINWEAEVYLNGHDLGRINGAFIRGKFDVSELLNSGGKNVLAVKVIKNDTPGFPTEQNRVSTDANGGELGGDNPTFHASIGWDWIPTIRGRNTGIWNDVYLSQSGPVTITDPFVSSKLPLPDTTSATVNVEVTLQNHSAKTVTGKLHGMIGYIAFEQPVTLEASETKTIKLDPSTNPSLQINHPKLWWPNGYGNQNLYDVKLTFVTDDGNQSDEKTFKTGIREMSYTENGGALRMYVNGKRFVPFGGNWGFSEDMLRYRGREYDIAVRYHKEMNFTMIRNWVGQIGDDEFFQACDKYGIMVWQDFWLANPSDGPDPYYPDMFIKNMEDFVKKIRNHPSIGIYVGRNEGNPPPEIQAAIDKDLPVLAPGIKYIPNSAFGTVSGGGPYGLMPLKSYFQNKRALTTLHSEMGMPDIVTYESFKQMMPEADIWPQSADWGLHDFTLEGAQRGENFNAAIEKSFGKVNDMKDWLSLAHWVEYQGYRAMFEAEAKYRMGLLLWMSHPAWPSLTWQTYDYYFDPTAAYFASKKACEPLHIQWNPSSDSIEVVNYATADGSGLTASLQLVNLDGTVKYRKDMELNCPEDSTVAVLPVVRPTGIDSVYFIRLNLTKGNHLISQNLYLRGANQDSTWGMGDLKELMNLPKIKLHITTNVYKKGRQWFLTTTLINRTKYPAFNIRLKVVGAENGKRILPVIYNDNYITLLPGEDRTIQMELKNEDTRGEVPAVTIEGFNLK